MALIEEKALEALSSLGEASPLAAAKVVEDRRAGAVPPAPAEANGRRAELAQVARRRMKAAESMAASSIPSLPLLDDVDPEPGHDLPGRRSRQSSGKGLALLLDDRFRPGNDGIRQSQRFPVLHVIDGLGGSGIA